MSTKAQIIWIVSVGWSFLAIAPGSFSQQEIQKNSDAATAVTAGRAIALAEQGRCKEVLATLKRTLNGKEDPELRKKAGLLGVRCTMGMDDRAGAGEFLGLLRRSFPHDAEVLYVMAHAYSDLSTRAAGELAETAPRSVEARKLNAESLEVQGKWDEAAKEYQAILEDNPKQIGIHYRVARLLLSKPAAGPEVAEQARHELLQELAIDSRNAGAEFILGELAKANADWDEAVLRFSSAAKLDASFGDAFLEWGFALVSAKRFNEAVAPLQVAARLEPGNPSAHYNLGTALSRSGQKEEANREFAIQKELNQKLDAQKNAHTEPRNP